MKLKSLLYFLFIVSIMMSCADSEDGLDGMDGVDGTNVLFNLVNEPSGTNCEFGGVRIDVGNDTNANDILDQDEIKGSTYVCNGADGTDGVDGTQVLVMTEVEPVGDNCDEGGSKMSVGLDVNGDGILNDTEITETVYICNGESAASLGKTYITLTGDLNDAEVAAILERDLGENTQFIEIREMPNITTLDLSSARRLIELEIWGCENLVNLNIENLEEVYAYLNIFGNSIETLNLSHLRAVYDGLSITEHLKTLDLSSLSILGISTIYSPTLTELQIGSIESGELLISFGQIQNFDFSFLSNADNLSLNIYGDNLQSLDFSNLSKLRKLIVQQTSLSSLQINNLVEVEQEFIIDNNSNLELFEANSLVKAGGLSFSGNSVLNNVSFPKVDSSGFVGLADNASLANFSMPLLTKAQNVSANFNPLLVSLNFPLLDDARFSIYYNHSLESLELPSFSNLTHNEGVYVDFSNNKFNSNTVNYLLAKYSSLTPTLTGAQIILTQSVAAPPTGQGIIDKATLIDNGNTVYTD
jgi:hypothetical protein